MAQLRQLMAEVLAIPEAEVVPELSMAGSDAWDSLRHMELVISVEETFEIELTGDEIVDMTSVAAIRSVLSGKGL